MDHAMLLMSNRPYCAGHNDRAGHQVYSQGDSIWLYWQTALCYTDDSCRLWAYTCMMRLKLQWFDLLSIKQTNKIPTNPQQIEPVEFKP